MKASGRMRRILTGVLFLAVMVAVVAYAVARLLMTVALSPEYLFVEQFVSWMLLIAELFILLHAFGYAADLFRASLLPDIAETPTVPPAFPLPAVAVLVAARHEPKEVLEATFRSLTNLRYSAKTIYFLDDSSEESYRREADALAAKFGLTIFRREERHGAKAGIVNDCLRGLTEKYVAIFDADQQPMPNFLERIVPLLEADPKAAFVQTPQFYSNIDRSRVAHAAGYQQAIFYEYICEAKGSQQSMFCCGTNVLLRRDALLEVGGFDERYVTEDFATSLRLHAKGWRSLYYNHVGAFGMGPETLAAYFKQQSRWARGTIGVFRTFVRRFLLHPFSLGLAQWWEYLLSSTYYFFGVIFVLLMTCPIVYILFDIPSFFIHTDLYLSVFIPYFLLSFGVFLLTLRRRHYRIRDLFLGQMLAYVTFPVLVEAAVRGLTGFQGSFGVTMKGKGRAMSYWALWPQLAFLLLNFIAFVWGLNRFSYERDFSVLVSCFWVLYHWTILLSVFYFNEDSPEEGAMAPTPAPAT